MIKKMSIFIALILMVPFCVNAEEVVTDGTANFQVNVTDSTPPTVISYVTTINQDISIDIAKNYNGYAWIKVENKSNVPVNVSLDSVEPIGNNRVATKANENDLSQKYVNLNVNNDSFTLREAGYKFQKDFTAEEGKAYSFNSQNDNIGLMELQVKLSDNWIIEDSDELTYSVTVIVEKNEDVDVEYLNGFYHHYDKGNQKIYYLVTFIEDLTKENTTLEMDISTYLYSGQIYNPEYKDNTKLVAESEKMISDTQKIHYYLFEGGNEYYAIDYGVSRARLGIGSGQTITSEEGYLENIYTGVSYNHSDYRYLSDDITLFSNYYKS